MSDLATAPRTELIALVYELIDKVHNLEAENAHLREQLHQKGKDKDSSPKVVPNFVKANVKKKGQVLRKKRENSYHRMKEIATEQIFHSADNCSNCGGELGKPSVAYRRQVIDIPVTPYTVTEHVVFKRWCINCQERILPEVDLSEYCLGQGRIGLSLATSIALLRDRCRLPVGVIQTYLKLFHNLKLSQGEIVEILHTAANSGRDRYNKLFDELKASKVVYADETGGRENGSNGYFWSLSTPKVHLLLYRGTRSSKVVKEVFGEDGENFEGVLVSDFYYSYNCFLGEHQRCWVHLLRDIKDLKKEFPKHPPLNKWAKQVKDIYNLTLSYKPPPNLKVGEEAEARVKAQRYFEEKLLKICKPYLSKDTPMSNLCGRIYTYLNELFTFVKYPEVKSHNNDAERILRHTVVSRKISGGTRSPKGSETKTILTSLFDTWKLQDLNPFEQMKSMLALGQ